MTCLVFATLNIKKLILFQLLQAWDHQHQIEHKISFKISVLRPSEAAWGPSYGLFCISIGLRSALPSLSTSNFEHRKLVLFQVLRARDHQQQIELKFSFHMSVLRPSETVWSSSYDLFCI